jgi:hypothetical protein
MQRLEVSGAVQPLKWPFGVKWLILEPIRINGRFWSAVFGDKQ